MSSSVAVLHAIVLGFNGAPSPDVPALRYADDDAANYARLFDDAGANVTLLTEYDADSRTLHADRPSDGPPTLDALRQAIDQIAGLERRQVTGRKVDGLRSPVQLEGRRRHLKRCLKNSKYDGKASRQKSIFLPSSKPRDT